MTDTPIAIGTTLLPVEPPSSLSVAANAEPSKPADLPPITTGTSERYIHGLARAVSRASATDPLTVLFQGEKLPPGQSTADLDLPALQHMVYEASLARLNDKLTAGGFVVEAGNFAAVACWVPVMVGETHAQASTLAQRPFFRKFLQRDQELMREHLYPLAERVSGGRFWKLSLMARDPEVEYVPGAVRAVLVPFIEQFTSDQNEGGPMPVWLEAGSEQARAVYAHFGFRDVGEIDVGGVMTWCMMYTGDIDVGH
ncbi:hypothetical protein F4781DRAFT_402760 [Annulohypoxylon bovei var. microspora]|nr:hypothetical protein F4781DRAFT_402760 [Annulohypoxylon bovei var. microspora]